MVSTSRSSLVFQFARSCSRLPVLRASSEPDQSDCTPISCCIAALLVRSSSSRALFIFSKGGTGSSVAMAGAMKSFLVAFLVVVVAAVAVHAHNGVDHGPAAAPHDSESGAATLVASLMAPLLIAAGAFAASALQL